VCESEKGEFVWERDGVGLVKVCVRGEWVAGANTPK
jgi:hypothetical protein